MSTDEQPMNRIPPLQETFPVSKYPLREVGTGFSAQSVTGKEADECAVTASEMMTESRTKEPSAASTVSEGGSSSSNGGSDIGEQFIVSDLPHPQGVPKDGMIILRNESLFPGMVGISLPLQGVLWVREDGTFNSSGFFRRQIPKFEAAALMAAATKMKEFIDVYHALYRGVVERAVQFQQYKTLRTVIEAGLEYYKEDCQARTELLDVRRRVGQIRAEHRRKQRSDSWQGSESQADSQARTPRNSGPCSNGDGSAGKAGERMSSSDEAGLYRSRPSLSGDGSVEDGDMSLLGSGGKGRVSRQGSDNDRPAKIAQQVVEGAPKQQAPFRLWKNKKGAEIYDKTMPS